MHRLDSHIFLATPKPSTPNQLCRQKRAVHDTTFSIDDDGAALVKMSDTFNDDVWPFNFCGARPHTEFPPWERHLLRVQLSIWDCFSPHCCVAFV